MEQLVIGQAQRLCRCALIVAVAFQRGLEDGGLMRIDRRPQIRDVGGAGRGRGLGLLFRGPQ